MDVHEDSWFSLDEFNAESRKHEFLFEMFKSRMHVTAKVSRDRSSAIIKEIEGVKSAIKKQKPVGKICTKYDLRAYHRTNHHIRCLALLSDMLAQRQ